MCVAIDGRMLRVFQDGEELRSAEYSLVQRTQRITGAYWQDFGPFALFEYRDGDGINGKTLLVGNALAQDGGYEEVLYKRDR